MPIFQTNLWLCEVCDYKGITLDEVSPYSDPVVAPPNGEAWDYIDFEGKERLACPKCLKGIFDKNNP